MKRVLLVLLLVGCTTTPRSDRYDYLGLHEKKPEKAIDLFSQAIDMEPTRPEFWRHRGDARVRLGDLDGAIADYTESLRRAQIAETYVHRARARFKKKLCALAELDATAAIEHDPSCAPAYRLRARIKADTGDEEGAKGDEARAAELE